ncbi:hypothetical protein UT300012_21440 [Paraclostridium bifermentans]
MFKNSKVYKELYEVYKVVDLFEYSCRVLEQSRGMVDREYPRSAKRDDFMLDFNNVKDKVDNIRDKRSTLVEGSERNLGSEFRDKLVLLSSELKANIDRIDENIGRFIKKYDLIDTSDSIEPRKAKKEIRTLATDDNIDGIIYGDLGIRKRGFVAALVDESLRPELSSSSHSVSEFKKVPTSRVVEMSEEDKHKALERHTLNKIESFKRYNLDTTELEKKLDEIVPTPAKPKLTKGQRKKLTSPFRNKMSACHKYYNTIKDSLTQEGIINVYEHAVGILHEFGGVKDYLNNVDLDELNALLKRVDKLSAVQPGLLDYDFSEYRAQIEECKKNLLNQ